MALQKIEPAAGAVFGDRRRPLLLSVRSGARESMPGMMDTVLNIGLNDDDRDRASSRCRITRALRTIPTAALLPCLAMW